MATRTTRKDVNKATINEKSGRKRVPIHASRDVMTLDQQDPNFVYRWVNDVKEGTRIKRFEEAGYEVVSKEEAGQIGDRGVESTTSPGDAATKVVGVDEQVGRPVAGVLMKIKREWYEEDQGVKEERIRRRERAIVEENALHDSARGDGEFTERGTRDGYYGKGMKKVRTI